MRTALAIVIAGIVQTAAPAFAQAVGSPHLRPDPALRALVDDAAQRSSSIRALIDRLETLDVIVYVRSRMFLQTQLEGRVGIVATRPRSPRGFGAPGAGRRILVIELAAARTELQTMATLGHELHHAVEIAGEPWIVDARTLAAFYTTRGTQISDRVGQLMFETEGAEQTGRRARREIVAAGERQTWTSK